MVRAKLKFRLHRAVIVLICLALLVALMQGASWFSQNSQKQRNPRSGESVEVRDRLALDGKKAGGYFNQQIVEPVPGKNGPLGYLRLTLDTHTLATEAKQVDNTTNILRLMLLLSLAIGVVLTRTLLQGKRTRWQQSPFLLTANKPVEDEDDEKKGNL